MSIIRSVLTLPVILALGVLWAGVSADPSRTPTWIVAALAVFLVARSISRFWGLAHSTPKWLTSYPEGTVMVAETGDGTERVLTKTLGYWVGEDGAYSTDDIVIMLAAGTMTSLKVQTFQPTMMTP